MFVPKKKPYSKYIDLEYIGKNTLEINGDNLFKKNMAYALSTSKYLKDLARNL